VNEQGGGGRVAALAHRLGTATLVHAGVRTGDAPAAGGPDARERSHAACDPALWTVGRERLHALLRAADDPTTTAEASAIGIERAVVEAVLGAPAELLVLLGGDSRVIPADGRNPYGLPAFDREPRVRLSSCTASTPDARALTTVGGWQRQAAGRLARDGLDAAVGALRAGGVADVRRCFDLPEVLADRIALSPSGTDAASLVTAVAFSGSGRPLRIILVGSGESGAGTALAAGGRRFRDVAPFTAAGAVGDPLLGIDPAAITVVDVALRDGAGRPRRAFDVEAEIEAHLEAGIDAAADVLVGVMYGSKTGIRVPDREWVRRWRSRHPDRLRIIVDAAQGRVSGRDTAEFLDAGASVLLSGSKAHGAPPFCGAVVFDASLVADSERLSRLPAGLACSVARADLPPMLRHAGDGFEPINLGLLARWRVAADESERSRDYGRSALVARRALVAACRSALADLENIVLLPPTPADDTIVSFLVRSEYGDHRVFGKAGCRQIYDAVVANGVYIGQPVELTAGGPAVLRVAVGTATVNATVASGSDPVRYASGQAAIAVDAIRDGILTADQVGTVRAEPLLRSLLEPSLLG